MSNLTENTVIDDVIKHEKEINQGSRDKKTLLSGETCLLGEVLGKVLLSIPTTGTLGSGTNGTCTAVTGGVSTQKGTYKATCTTANEVGAAGVWRIEAPDGAVLGDLTVTQGTSGTGSFTDPQINLTISYATGYSTIGDYFNIAVTDGSLKMVQLDSAAVDGSQKAAGVITHDCDASSADAACSVLVRDALVRANMLRYRIDFTGGGTTTPVAGDTITGLTTTTTSARIVSVTLASGTWAGGNAAGYFIVDTLTGDFAAENVEINSSTTDDATVALFYRNQSLVDLASIGIIAREEA